MENNKDISMEDNKDIDKEEVDVEEEDVGDLDAVIQEKEEQIRDLSNKFLRLQADFANYKKRTDKEKKGLVEYGVETFVCELLPILDNFERALKSEEDKESSLYEGVQMIYNQLLDLLAKNDIKEIDALNNPFDPNFHHAVSMEESEEHKEGTIIQILQKGYILNDKVIRPSMVIVSQ